MGDLAWAGGAGAIPSLFSNANGWEILALVVAALALFAFVGRLLRGAPHFDCCALPKFKVIHHVRKVFPNVKPKIPADAAQHPQSSLSGHSGSAHSHRGQGEG
jgi:hypothetical protein